MATTYPGDNDGLVPLDPATPVGQFRIMVGDTTAEAYDPPVAGRGNYAMFSDLEIEGFIAAAGDNLYRAVGFSYLTLAGQAARESKSVKDFDLSIDLTKRATDLRLIADTWFVRADDQDAYLEDAFFIAPLGDVCDPIPEGMMPRWGRYAVGKWSC